MGGQEGLNVNRIHVRKCRKDMNENQYFHNTRDTTHEFPTNMYLKSAKYTFLLFIRPHTFSTGANMLRGASNRKFKGMEEGNTVTECIMGVHI